MLHLMFGIALSALHWLCVAIGASVLLLIVLWSLISVALFYFYNWETTLSAKRTCIRRLTGWRSAIWYVADEEKNFKEFGAILLMQEQLALKRSLRTVSANEPIWKIYHYWDDGRVEAQTVVSFYANDSVFVRRKEGQMPWNTVQTSATLLQASPLNDLMTRAIGLQKDIEKRCKPILAKASVS